MIKAHPFTGGDLENVVVRDEYPKALEACAELSETRHAGNLMVVGHSGIGACVLLVPVYLRLSTSRTGKTMFLYFVLTHRLRLRLPTFYQNTPGRVFYFNESGVYSIPANQTAYNVNWESEDIWSLFDSSVELIKPGVLIGGMHPPWLLAGAAFPHYERWSGWPKYKGRLRFFSMKPTTFAEIVMA